MTADGEIAEQASPMTFGGAVRNGVILISQLNHLLRSGHNLHEAIVTWATSRLRPVAMTALMAMLGPFPAVPSTSVGSETAKPFAAVIIGGLVTVTVDLDPAPAAKSVLRRRIPY